MENLYHQIAGTNFMIAFAAADGLLLDTIADDSFLATATASSICPGTLWTELQCGTNALGTVAETARRTMVHGAEHFFASHSSLTCTAAPVFDPEGTLAGVLDASSDCRSRQEHTRALVGMAATQVENGLFRDSSRSQSRGRLPQPHRIPPHARAPACWRSIPTACCSQPTRRPGSCCRGCRRRPGGISSELFRTGFAAFRDAGLEGERAAAGGRHRQRVRGQA